MVINKPLKHHTTTSRYLLISYCDGLVGFLHRSLAEVKKLDSEVAATGGKDWLSRVELEAGHLLQMVVQSADHRMTLLV